MKKTKKSRPKKAYFSKTIVSIDLKIGIHTLHQVPDKSVLRFMTWAGILKKVMRRLRKKN